jgi:regulator of replication initiation timing
VHPVFEEFCRARELRPEVLHRIQRVVRTDIQPLLDERETLIEENAKLRERVAELEAKAGRQRKGEAVPA